MAHAVEDKGIAIDSPLAAEEWFAGPVVVLRILRLLMTTLRRLDRGQPAIDEARIHTRPDGRVRARVFPASNLDAVLFPRFSADVWMRPGVTATEVVSAAGAHYRMPPDRRPGRVALVLGAGNVASIAPTDVLYKMFVEGRVCVLKMNPLNAVMGPLLERGFRAAIEQGLLLIVYGGTDVGAYLTEHPLVDEVHVTGARETHDLIVWGETGNGRHAREARRGPRLAKRITSELGNISPVIIVPGPYTDREIRFQADSIAAAVVNNGSFNCNAARLLVAPAAWPGRRQFRDALARSLASAAPRQAYYPGAERRWAELVDRYPWAQQYGERRPGVLPWTLIPEVDAGDEPLFSREWWCPVVVETTLRSSDPGEFLGAAVDFCNERVWGTLSATIVVHPRSLTDPRIAAALETALEHLRYGTIAINHWPALGFVFGTTPWGGHPSATLEDIQSGRGWVHNAFMLDEAHIEKCVVRGPLVVRPRPPWFPGHRRAHRLGRRLADMEAAPSAWKLPGIVLDALRGWRPGRHSSA